MVSTIETNQKNPWKSKPSITSKHLEVPSTEGQLKKMWDRCATEHHSDVRRNGAGSSVETWMDTETVIQSEANQKKKNRYHILMHVCGILKNGISSVQSLSYVRLFATPWIAARQASLSIINSRSSLRLTSIQSVMPSSHLILCCPLLLLPPIPPSIRVFSNESTLPMRWPKYWSFSFSIFPSRTPRTDLL